jgi:hypothetical protein
MDEFEKIAEGVSKRWASTTLASFRLEAEKMLNGTVYEAIRPSTNGKDGPRLFLILCITGRHELSLAEKIFRFAPGGLRRDWDTYTLADMLLETAGKDGLAYQDLTSGGKRIAATVCASGPEKVSLLEKLFSLPP